MKTASLFDSPEYRRDCAMECADKAAPPDWKQRAIAVVEALIEGGKEFSGDDIWELLDHPPEARALGPIIQSFRIRGAIEHVGFNKSRRPERHCAPVSMWRKKT